MKFVEIDYTIIAEDEPKCCGINLTFYKLSDVIDGFYKNIIVSYCENCKTKGFYEPKK